VEGLDNDDTEHKPVDGDGSFKVIILQIDYYAPSSAERWAVPKVAVLLYFWAVLKFSCKYKVD
jgi:hypothetical protein